MCGSVYIGNRGGIPVVSTSATVGTADVRISLPNHIFRFLGVKGKIIVELDSALPTAAATFPVYFLVNGTTLQLSNTTGALLTGSDLGSAVYMEIIFDKAKNALVLTSTIS